MHEIIRPVLEKYLTDNGAAPICKTHLDPLTNAIAKAIESTGLSASGRVGHKKAGCGHSVFFDSDAISGSVTFLDPADERIGPVGSPVTALFFKDEPPQKPADQ